MQTETFAIDGPKLITPARFDDARGSFSETYNQARFAESGIADTFVMDAWSRSIPVHTLRGLHFQKPPHAQAKLIRAQTGRIFDAAVDLRQGSATYGGVITCELDAALGNQLYLPRGFAHGFLTLTPDCEVAYKLSAFYAPDHEAGVNPLDPALTIAWPVSVDNCTLQDRDRNFPPLADIGTFF